MLVRPLCLQRYLQDVITRGPGRYQLIPKEALTGYMIVLTPHPTWISGAKDNYVLLLAGSPIESRVNKAIHHADDGAHFQIQDIRRR
ncbi:MAG: hypothetical protein ACTSUE_19945 [Promethearchaeota archaeon]